MLQVLNSSAEVHPHSKRVVGSGIHGGGGELWICSEALFGVAPVVMSGPASETSVLLSAGVSLVVFVCCFANILLAVPKHWGVPYKDRLSRFVPRSRHGMIAEALNAGFSLVRSVDKN